jgi:hypothetical protein
MALYGSKKIADEFYLGEKEATSPGTRTIYGLFVQAHYAVKTLRDGAIAGHPETNEQSVSNVRAQLDDISAAIDQFLLDLQSKFKQNIDIEAWKKGPPIRRWNFETSVRL